MPHAHTPTFENMKDSWLLAQHDDPTCTGTACLACFCCLPLCCCLYSHTAQLCISYPKQQRGCGLQPVLQGLRGQLLRAADDTGGCIQQLRDANFGRSVLQQDCTSKHEGVLGGAGV